MTTHILMRDTRTEEQRVRDWLDRQLAAAPRLTDAQIRRICLLLNPAPTQPTMALRVTHNQTVA